MDEKMKDIMGRLTEIHLQVDTTIKRLHGPNLVENGDSKTPRELVKEQEEPSNKKLKTHQVRYM
jgi:hypothetical protein